MRNRRYQALILSTTFLLLGTTAESAKEPCNPYYPLPLQGEWTYREGTNSDGIRLQKTVRVQSLKIEAERETATLEQSVIGPGSVAMGRARVRAVCAGGGIEVDVEGVAEGKEGGATARGRVSAKLPGLPPADKLVAGHEWVSHSRIETVEQGHLSVTEGLRKNRVAGYDTVTTPAGTFPRALKILAQETLRQKKEGREARQELVEWYVRDLGLVKRETRILSETSAVTSTEVLISSNLLPER